jgi:hypothetical protein
VSDQRLKTNINNYTGALSKVLQLIPKTYSFKTREYDFMNLPAGEQIGLIAQDVEKVFPGLVENGFHPGKSDAKGRQSGGGIAYKGMNYIGLTPILVQAIKEQQQIIDGLKNEVDMLKAEFEKFKKEVAVEK